MNFKLKVTVSGVFACFLCGSFIGAGIFGIMPIFGKFGHGIPLLILVVTLFAASSRYTNEWLDIVSSSVFIATLGFNIDNKFVDENYWISSFLVGTCAIVILICIFFKKKQV